MTTYVSLTRSGIPRFIPPQYRKILRRGDDPRVIRVVLSICALSRLIKVVPKRGLRVNPSTIHIPNFQLGEPAQKLCVKLLTSGFSMLGAYAPAYRKIPLRLGFSFKPMFTSGPNTTKDFRKESSVKLRNSVPLAEKWKKFQMTIYHSLPVDASALFTLFKPEDLAVIGSLWFSDREIIPDSGYDNPVDPVKEGTDGFGWLINSLLPPAQALWWDTMVTRPEAGRFGRKLEGSGKIRLFAIANPIFQTLLRPLHDWVMKVLSTIKMDGTFNQLAPLHRLKGMKDLYSFDLKSAQVEEGLLPVDLSGSLLASLFGDSLAQSWCFLMTMVGFRSPDRLPSRLKARVYRFTRGQPLGYYSSWPVFTLTHHALVWLAAYEVYPGRRFEDYAILGDDIVIADRKVALEYQRIMEEAQGIRVGSDRLFDHLSLRWKRHWLTLFSTSGIHPLPFKLWLAYPEKGILNCYEEGAVRAFILGRVEPKDLDEKSISELNTFWVNDDDMMLERL
ncbi:unnamed protein product [Ilex paraguariensis]|uniref:RNA-dependent RNA polymerase n=1 Tax=Ilex paraguariensis TaxID=185542 RepID=A0ABC8SF04_9AQUA